MQWRRFQGLFQLWQMLLLNALWLFSVARSECFVMPRDKNIGKGHWPASQTVARLPWFSSWLKFNFPTMHISDELLFIKVKSMWVVLKPGCVALDWDHVTFPNWINVSCRQAFSLAAARSRSTYISWRDMTIITETRWNGDDLFIFTRPRQDQVGRLPYKLWMSLLANWTSLT